MQSAIMSSQIVDLSLASEEWLSTHSHSPSATVNIQECRNVKRGSALHSRGGLTGLLACVCVTGVLVIITELTGIRQRRHHEKMFENVMCLKVVVLFFFEM